MTNDEQDGMSQSTFLLAAIGAGFAGWILGAIVDRYFGISPRSQATVPQSTAAPTTVYPTGQ